MPFPWKDLHVRRMIDREQSQVIEIHHLFELVGDAQLETGRCATTNCCSLSLTYSSASGTLQPCGSGPIAHLAAAKKIRHELERRAVPGIQEGTRRRLAIELGNDDRAATNLKVCRHLPSSRPGRCRPATARARHRRRRVCPGRRSGPGPTTGGVAATRSRPLPQAAGANVHFRARGAAVADPPAQADMQRSRAAQRRRCGTAEAAPLGSERGDVVVAVAVDVADSEGAESAARVGGRIVPPSHRQNVRRDCAKSFRPFAPVPITSSKPSLS